MRFKAYEIRYVKKGVGQETDEIRIIDDMDDIDLYKKLNQFPRIEDGTQEYTIMYNSREQHIITGVLAQSYDPMLSKFAPGNIKEEIPIPENKANDKTYFYIDVKKKQLFIQNKRYPTKSINLVSSLRRMESILSEILSKAIQLNPIRIEYRVDELICLFNKTFVEKIEYSNLSGHKLPLDARLHNPREDLDSALIDTWNTYCGDSIDSLAFKASDGKSLNKNPLAQIGILLAGEAGNTKNSIIKKIAINDDEGFKEELKPKGNEFKIVPIQSNKREDYQYVFEKIFDNTTKGDR